METDRSSAIPFALLCYGGDHETRLAMTSKSWISRLGALLTAFVLTVVPSASPAHAVEDARKVSVVSFGLFGDQGVFKSEATSAAQVVASRFGNGPINVQYNSKRGGGATIEALAMSLQVAAKGMDAENDGLFLILTSHGSPPALPSKQGGSRKHSRRLISPTCWRGPACDTRWWSSRPAIPGSLFLVLRTPTRW